MRADARWADTGVDIGMAATLHYADGRCAQMSCAMDAATHRYATIACTRGTIETEYLNHTSAQAGGHPYGYLPSRLRVRRGVFNTIPFEDLDAGTGSGFRFAVEAFARVVHARDVDAIGRAAAASLDIAATLEALAESARTGREVELQAVSPA
ncbi:hypothetical protein V4F39_01045 [Aquincola sp. MAHUQ-54]|uniref:Gfo/Idh/MocA-like oxidoreductase C-terminal domain-containing protein n=1 Tax=Aquincola agrisoli TaxID=3119538 RepID=A0AAW9QCV8_9BURK